MPHTLVVGLHHNGNDPFWLQVEDAIYQQAKAYPIELVPIVSSVPSDAQEFDAQLTVVEELLALELHAVIGWWWPEKLALPVLEAGLPIVHLSETGVEHPLSAAPHGLYAVAQLAADYLAGQLQGRGTVLVVGGLLRPILQDDGRSRLAGIEAVFGRYPALRWRHVPSAWDESAPAQIAAALEGHDTPVDGILGLSDSLTLAAREAAAAHGLLHERTVVVGINGDPLALAAITRGDMAATVETDPCALAARAVELAYRGARREPLPKIYPYTYQLVTTANVAAVAARRLVATAALPNHLVDAMRRAEQQHRVHLETSLAISHRIGALRDRRRLAQEVADIIRTHYGYDRALLYGWNATDKTLVLEGQPPEPGQLAAITPGQGGLLMQAFLGNEAIFIPDTRRSLRFAPDPLWPATQARLVLPIRLEGQVLGLLDLHRTQGNLHLGREQLVGLRSLADQLGIAMYNTRLLLRVAETAPASPPEPETPLTPVLIDVRDLVATAVNDRVRAQAGAQRPRLRLALPARLPLIQTDRTCLAQTLQHLLACAQQCAAGDSIAVQATLRLPYLRITLAGLDPAAAIQLVQVLEQVDESALPVALETVAGRELHAGQRYAKRLHGAVAIALGDETSLDLDLPLPTLAGAHASDAAPDRQEILLVAGSEVTLAALCDLAGPYRVQRADTAEGIAAAVTPGALAWDAACAAAGEWALLADLRRHATFATLPFLLLPPQQETSVWTTAAAMSEDAMARAIAACCPDTAGKSLTLLVADAAQQRAYQLLAGRELPGIPIHTAAPTREAIDDVRGRLPAFLLLEVAPGEDDLLGALCNGEPTCHLPILLLTGQPIDDDLLHSYYRFTALTLCATGILTGAEIAALIRRVLVAQYLPQPHSGDLARQTVAYLHRHYADPLSRAELAAAVGVSENYLSQVFRQEIGISLWEYLSRYRISRAQVLLRQTAQSVTAVAAAVGIPDSAYFSRIFHRQVGMSPSAYRVASRRNTVA